MPSVYLQTKSGKEKLGIVPCSKEVFPELVELPTKNRFMLVGRTDPAFSFRRYFLVIRSCQNL